MFETKSRLSRPTKCSKFFQTHTLTQKPEKCKTTIFFHHSVLKNYIFCSNYRRDRICAVTIHLFVSLSYAARVEKTVSVSESCILVWAFITLVVLGFSICTCEYEWTSKNKTTGTKPNSPFFSRMRSEVFSFMSGVCGVGLCLPTVGLASACVRGIALLPCRWAVCSNCVKGGDIGACFT